ncbi:hypothetical protein DV736_g5759, partial [Chaetothyriales sp. CBS 134916]
MNVNKNRFKIGLRLSVALSLIYVVYNLVSAFSGLSLPFATPELPGIGAVLSHVDSAAPPLQPPIEEMEEIDKVDIELAFSSPPPDEDGLAYKPSAPTTATTNAITDATASTTVKASVSVSSSHSPSKWTSEKYTDKTLSIPIRHLVLTNTDHDTGPTLLVLVMTKDSSSWAAGRNFSSFLEMLAWTELDPTTISLTLFTSSEEEFQTYSTQALHTDYASLHLIYHPGYTDIGTWRLFRHWGGIQHARRVEMARLRNYASLTSLVLSHEHLLWIDADVYELSPGLVQSMLNFSSVYPQVGIQTAISHLGDSDGDYDSNTWVGMRSSPNAKERAKLREDKSAWVPNSVPGKSKHLGDLRREFEEARAKQDKAEEVGRSDRKKRLFGNDPSKSRSAPSDDSPDDIDGLFRLDSVGATVLLMKSHLWRQGLSFATSYLVGTDFQDEGWDGVESEGLCVAARNLINEEYGRQGGVGCWGLVHGYTRHSDS